MWILTGHFCRNLIVTPKHKDKLVFSGDAMNKVGGEMTLFKSAHGLEWNKVFRELYPDFPPNLSFEF